MKVIFSWFGDTVDTCVKLLEMWTKSIELGRYFLGKKICMCFLVCPLFTWGSLGMTQVIMSMLILTGCTPQKEKKIYFYFQGEKDNRDSSSPRPLKFGLSWKKKNSDISPGKFTENLIFHVQSQLLGS